MGWGPTCLDSSLGPATCMLRALGQVSSALSGSVSSPGKWSYPSTHTCLPSQSLGHSLKFSSDATHLLPHLWSLFLCFSPWYSAHAPAATSLSHIMVVNVSLFSKREKVWEQEKESYTLLPLYFSLPTCLKENAFKSFSLVIWKHKQKMSGYHVPGRR